MTKKTVKKKAAPKKTPPKKTTGIKVSNKAEEPSLKIIKTGSCSTISNKSTLKYNVGVNDEGHMNIRVLSNTGGGFFSNEWVSLDSITAVLGEVPGDHPITSINLIPLFKGKSVNTPGYLLAVLLNEKMLKPFEDKKRQFTYTGAKTLSTKPSKRKASK